MKPFIRHFRPEARPHELRASFVRRKRLQEGLHRWTLLPRQYKCEIIMFFRERNESEAHFLRDRRDGDAPVGSVLCYCGGDRVM